jgi:hypothetical protein
VVTKETVEKREKKDPEFKGKPPSRELNKYQSDQVKTDCEHCGKHSPDVEYYRHNNKLIAKRWLCMRCADDGLIQTTCARQTRACRQEQAASSASTAPPKNSKDSLNDLYHNQRLAPVIVIFSAY